YVDRVKFGLMTFDGIGTLTTTSPLVPASTYNTAAFLAQAQGSAGMYSYAGPKQFTFPGCGVPYMIDNGSRNETADVGRLISVGSDAIATIRSTNSAIQSSLGSVRAFGATPVAGLLDDFRYYLNNNADVQPVLVAGGAGDVYAQCRDRYAVL